MKIGTIFDEIGAGLVSSWLSFLDKNEVTSGEIRTIDGVNVDEQTLYQAETCATMLAQSGKIVTCLASNLGKTNLIGPNGKLDEDVVELEIAKAVRLVARAKIYDTRVIRAFGGFHQKDMTTMWPIIKEFVPQIVAVIPDNMFLAFENEPATGLSMPSDVLTLSQFMKDDPRIRLLADVGNIIFDVDLIRALERISPSPKYAKVLLNTLIENELKACQGLISVVHLKNLKIEPPAKMEARTVGLDRGLVDFGMVLKTLNNIGYEGPIDLETHRAAAGRQISDAARHAPGGEGYGNPKDVKYDLKVARELVAGLII